MNIQMNDIGAFVKPVISHVKTLVAASTTADADATLICGEEIDRLGFYSAIATTLASATIADTKKMTHLMHLIHSDTSGEDFTVFATLDDTVDLIEGLTTGDVFEFNHKIDLSGAKRYIMLRTTADLTNTGTDKAVLSYVLTLGGATELPTTLS